MQILGVNNSSVVSLYHTFSYLSGMPGFECMSSVPVQSAILDENGDLLIACSACKSQMRVSLLGGTNSQKVHAHYKHFKRKDQTLKLEDSIASTLAAVIERNGAPSVDLAVEALNLSGGQAKIPDVMFNDHPGLSYARERARANATNKP